MDQEAQGDAKPGRAPLRNVFSCALYLFGMVMAAPVFTYLALQVIDPTQGGKFPQGGIDPLLTFIVLPVAGALLGGGLVFLANLVYGLYRRR